MPSYRLFKLDSESKRRALGEWLEAVDDDHALTAAKKQLAEAKCEVWLENRLVGIVACDG